MKSVKGLKYDSIDNMPVAIFSKIMRTGDLSIIGEGSKAALEKAWIAIFDQYLEAFGLGDYEQYLKLQQEAVRYYEKAYCQGQMHMVTIAELKEREAELMLSVNDSLSLDKAAAVVSKFMGFRVNPNEISVKEFYTYLQLSNG